MTTTSREMRSSKHSPGLVGIVVLNYQGAEKTLSCISSLKNSDYDNYRVVVVDNASKDGSADRILRKSPSIEYIQSQQNLGYAGGNALGVNRCLEWGAKYILVINNDTQIMPTTLGRMVRAAETSPKTGAVGCVIRDEQDPTRILAVGGGQFKTLFAKISHITDLDRMDRLNYLTGACLLIPSSVIQSIGFINEDYFLYWEDVDYCYRLRNRGYDLIVAQDASILHDESASLGKTSQIRSYYFTRSMVKFLYLNFRNKWMVLLFIAFTRQIIKSLTKSDYQLCRVLIHAAIDGIKNRSIQLHEMTETNKIPFSIQTQENNHETNN